MKVEKLLLRDLDSTEEKKKWWEKELADCNYCYRIPGYNLPSSLPIDASFKRTPEHCVDIGANVGAFSYYAAPHFNNIYAFEPVGNTYKAASENLQLLPNVKLYNLAAHSENEGEIKIAAHENSLSRDSSLYNLVDNRNYEVCKTISLEGIYELCGIDFIDYLKVDCEGSEYDLLMNKDLSKINFMAIEIHPGLIGQSKTTELLFYLKEYFKAVLAAGEHIILLKGKNI